MANDLLFDFSDLPQNSVQRQVVATEQFGILCGLNRRTSRRLGKTVFLILSNYPPETLFENSIRFKKTPAGNSIELHFSTHPQEISEAISIDKKLESLRRAGEKCAEFNLTGTPEKGFEIRFSEFLPVGFEIPLGKVPKEWARIIGKGDWEEAFGQLCKTYHRERANGRQIRDGLTLRKGILTGEGDQTNSILSLVASKSDNPVLILDGDGNAEWANLSFSKLTGAELSDDKTLSASELLFGQSDNSALQQINKSLAAGLTFNLEYSWQPDVEESESNSIANVPVWIEFQVTPVRGKDDKVVRWIAIGANITQRRNAELAMQAAKEIAETANKAKSDFLAMMSHEIRTPMNAIIGMTELTLGTQLTIDQRECLTTANNSAQSLLQILNDILDLSKVEAQRLELEQTDFNIADITRETLDTLGVLAQRKDLALRCTFPLDIHQQLVGDPMRLRQILVNLVGNAIKFTSHGYVEVGVELLDQTNDEITLHYTVRDTGVGIPENKTSRIFEAFFQTDASITRNFGGTGLGLAITSELIRLMGGRIWVESILGKGSAFHFVLTFKKSNRTFVSLPPDAGRQLNGKNILVIDDNEANRFMMLRWMNEWGINSTFAETGLAGLKLLKEQHEKFDLAIVDVVLPDIDGFKVVQGLLNPGCNVTMPIMMFSSDDRTATVERCREIGIQSYLIKPVSPKTLHNSIQLALGSTRDSLAGQPLTTGGSLGIEKTDQQLNILIVDDHASNRKLIGEILRRRGHRWREASEGQCAIKLIKNEKFDVVLMDVQMPEKDGLEVTADIRNLSGENSLLPIIAVTAYVTAEDRQRCLDASMDDYLAKPVGISDLLEKVERWGNTIREQVGRGSGDTLDDQLLIQDAPVWATQITRAIVVAEERTESDPTNVEVQGSSTNGSFAVAVSPRTNAALCMQSSDQPGRSANGMEPSDHPFPLALERFGGDEELLRMQISFFLSESPELVHQIQKAIRESDGKTLHLNAHRLKGLVRTYDDDLAAELTAKLEDMGRSDSFEGAEATFALLTERVSDLLEQLKSF